MDREILITKIRHLYEVEGLSQRQIAKMLSTSKTRVGRIIHGQQIKRKKSASILGPFERLIAEFYAKFPFLKATQVYTRLQSYGFAGSYAIVRNYTRKFRAKKSAMYHELEFLPGEEAQVDWLEARLPFGIVYGFAFILAWSRYLFARFFPHASLEFFLAGHIEAYQEINGVAHKNRYDNLKSVVLQRKPELKLNAQFMDFARHYGFSIHPCTPYRANEKGRVERVIRDIRVFLSGNTFSDIHELNRMLDRWRRERNETVHRSTGKPPKEALLEEKLRPLPAIHYRAYRAVTASISKTGFVELDTNRYSVPARYSGSPGTILAYPEHIEVVVNNQKVATHKRCFLTKQKIEEPVHRQKILDITPHYKRQRIYQLMRNLDQDVIRFIDALHKEGEDPLEVAYRLFKMLLVSSRPMLLSAIRGSPLPLHIPVNLPAELADKPSG